MKRVLASLTALVAVAALSLPTVGQVRYGGELSLGDDIDLGIGVRAAKDLDKYLEGLDGYLSFDLFFPGDNVSYWEIDVNVTYPIRIEGDGAMRPYFGGGIVIGHSSVDLGVLGDHSDTEIGLDLLIGTTFANRGQWTPFAELKLPFGGFEGVDFILCGGVYF